MKQEPSKISYQCWGETFTIEKPNSDLDMAEFCKMCRGLALAVGYTEATVNEYFNSL